MFNAGMSPLHVLYSGVVLLLLTINKKKKKLIGRVILLGNTVHTYTVITVEWITTVFL
jgi:hypothetical protein